MYTICPAKYSNKAYLRALLFGSMWGAPKAFFAFWPFGACGSISLGVFRMNPIDASINVDSYLKTTYINSLKTHRPEYDGHLASKLRGYLKELIVNRRSVVN